MDRIQDSETFQMLFQEVWSSTIPRVKIYYTTKRKLSSCIVYGDGESRFFLSIRDCVNWAGRNNLINSNKIDEVIRSAEYEAKIIEGLEDARLDAADVNYRMNQDIKESDGNLGAIARIIRKYLDPWAW